MKGFTDKCIILLPQMRYVETRQKTWDSQLITSVNTLCKYFERNGIASEFFANDDTAHAYVPNLENVVGCILPEDVELFSLNSGYVPQISVTDPVLENSTREKYPAARGLSDEEREQLMGKRIKYLVDRFLRTYQLVVDFSYKTTFRWPTNKFLKSNKLVVFIRPDTFEAIATLNTQPCAIHTVFTNLGSGLPVHMWKEE